jgi:phosphomannomutase
MIQESIFKSYDIRGIYPTELNEQNIPHIVRAIVEEIKQNSPKSGPINIALGCDMRLSSPILFASAKATMVNLGVNVLEVGLVSTPSLYFATLHFNCHGGIQISASHNPGNYNGLKIVRRGDKGLIKIGKTTGMEEIKRLATAYSDQPENHPVNMPGTVKTIDTSELLQLEIANAKKIAGDPSIKSFKIVADAANSMGATYLEALFKDLPGEFTRMNFKLDGTFPSHPADPLIPENLIDLQKRVIKEKADIGLAPDGDGDRMMFIDERGQYIPPSAITSLIAQEFLLTHPDEKILFDIRYVFTPLEVVKKSGGESVVTKVGHAFITEKMTEVGGIFGGESSGHYFFRDTGNAESQLPAILMVLSRMTKENKPLSKIIQSIAVAKESGEINFRVKNAAKLIDILQEHFSDGEIVKIDGVAVTYPEWRFSLRSSNTEPLLRLNVEELGEPSTPSKSDQIIEVINKHAEFDNE